MSELKQEFENWAISHGGLSLIPANGGECGNGWFPATYAHSMTEIAWRAFANRRAQPEANADAKDALLLKLRDYVDSKSQEYGYGFYRPANPHDFTPDSDECSEDEVAAHKAACEAYDKGEYTHDRSGCIREGGMHILHAPWGIGSYIIRDPEVQELLDQIDAARQAKEKGNV